MGSKASAANLRRGLLGFAVALVISPLGLIVLTLGVERRELTLSGQYLSFIVGDPLLACAVGIGFAVPSVRIPSWPAVVVPVVAGLAFGAWQMKHELDAGLYSPGQSFSPSHLWHQFVVYPALAVLLTMSVLRALRRRAAIAAIVVLVTAWSSLNLWDQQHPKNAHCEFDWASMLSTCD